MEFLNVAGVSGGSRERTFAGWIDVKEFTELPASGNKKTGYTLTVKMKVGVHSPVLQQLYSQGKVVDFVRHATAPGSYTEYRNVIITSIQYKGTEGEEREPVETATFDTET